MNKNLLFLSLLVCSLQAAEKQLLDKKASVPAGASAAAGGVAGDPHHNRSFRVAPSSPRGARADEPLSPRTAQVEYPHAHQFIVSYAKAADSTNPSARRIGQPEIPVPNITCYMALKFARRDWFGANRWAQEILSSNQDFENPEQASRDVESFQRIIARIPAKMPTAAAALAIPAPAAPVVAVAPAAAAAAATPSLCDDDAYALR